MKKAPTQAEVERARASVVGALVVSSMPRLGYYGDVSFRGPASLYRDDPGGYGDAYAHKTWLWDAMTPSFDAVKSKFDAAGQIAVFNAGTRFAGLYRETVNGFDGPQMVSDAMKAVSELPKEHGELAGRLIDGLTANATERLERADRSKDNEEMWSVINGSKRETRLEIAGLSHLVHNVGAERLAAMTKEQIRAEIDSAAKAVEEGRVGAFGEAARSVGTTES